MPASLSGTTVFSMWAYDWPLLGKNIYLSLLRRKPKLILTLGEREGASAAFPTNPCLDSENWQRELPPAGGALLSTHTVFASTLKTALLGGCPSPGSEGLQRWVSWISGEVPTLVSGKTILHLCFLLWKEQSGDNTSTASLWGENEIM